MSDWVYASDRLPSTRDGNTVIGFDGYDFEVVHTKYHAFNDEEKTNYQYSFRAFGNCPFKLKAWRRIDAPDTGMFAGGGI